MRWARHVACVGKRRGKYMILVRKSEGKSPLERRRCRREDNTKINIKEIKSTVDWIKLAYDRDRLWFVCEYGNEHSVSIKCG
jgi:hypothetical protein